LPYRRAESRHAFAAGGVISTADDLAIWMRALAGGKLFHVDYQRQWLDSLGLSQEQREHLERYSPKPDRGSIFGRALVEGRTVHIPDVVADPEFNRPQAPATIGVRAGVGVPLLREGIVVGILSVIRTEPRPFSRKQIELVETFADQAVIAIENVRLFDEIRDKSRQLAEASQRKSQFLASMSHELRTPLNAIIGLTEMMVTNVARFGTEKALEPLRRVNAAGTHLLSLINEVLDLSKIADDVPTAPYGGQSPITTSRRRSGVGSDPPVATHREKPRSGGPRQASHC
jgi:GAF domain-containing protein